MNWLDIVILCLCGVGLVKGLYDGAIKQLVAIVALIIGIYLCSGVAKWLCGYLIELEWFSQQWAIMASYFLGFVLIVGVVLLAGSVVHRLISATPLSIFNHIIGGIIGLVLMILFLSVLLNIIEMVDSKSVLLSMEIKTESHCYEVIKNIIPSFFPGNLFELKNELFT